MSPRRTEAGRALEQLLRDNGGSLPSDAHLVDRILAVEQEVVADAETTETMLRVLHHAAAEHIRVWHGSIPTKDRAVETTPLRLLINAIDLAGEHLGEARINHDKARQERKRAEYAARQGGGS
jgi:hypothetical protein